MANIQLKASPRTITGKKVGTLRRQGILPANIYGHGEASIAVQVPAQEFQDLLRHSGRSNIIELALEGAAPLTTMIRDVQRNAISRQLMHVDFLRVSMTETITMAVPLAFVGESIAVRMEGGTLVHALDHLTVTGLPGSIPGHIEVNVELLTELDQALFVRDLTAPEGIHIVTEEDAMVAKIAPPRVQEEEAAAAEAPEAGATEEAGTEQ